MARLKGSSIIEATIALALLTVIMGVAWLTFEQLLSNNRSLQEFQAQLLLEQRAAQIESNPFTASTQWDSLGYLLTHELVPVNETKGVSILNISCQTPDQREFYYRKLISMDQ